MKIKVTALLLITMLAIGLFSGCTASSSTDSGSSDGESKKEETTNLIWYQWGDSLADEKVVFEKLNELSKEAINVTVDFRYANDEKAKLIVSTNEYYDMIYSCSWQNNYVAQSQKGMFADLTQVLPESAPKLYGYIPENVWEGMKVNGKINGVPVYKDSAMEQYWAYYPSVMDAAGVTKEDLNGLGTSIGTATPILEKLKTYIDKNGPLSNGCDVAWSVGAGGFMPAYENEFVIRSGGGFVIPFGITDNKVIHILENQQYIKEQQIVKEWVDKGYVKLASKTSETAMQGAIYIVQSYLGAESELANSDFGVAGIKLKDKAYLSTDSITGAAHAISINCKKINKAVEYLEYCNMNEEYRNIFAYGIEGVHWEKQAQGNIKRTEKGQQYRPGQWSQATFGTLYDEYPTPAGTWKEVIKSQEAATTSPIIGFTPNTTNIETELANLDSVWAKFAQNIGFSIDLDAQVNKALSELKSVGLDKVKTELQTQIDKFLENK